MTASTVPQTTYQRIQSRVFRILEGDVTEPASRFCEIFIALLVVLNVVAIILESVPDIHAEWGQFFHYFDLFSVGVFTIEYVLRVWSYSQKFAAEGGTAWQGRKSYIFSFYGLVDFFSTVPFYLQLLFPGTDLRVLRMFRLLRIFKLSRYNSALDDMFEAIKAEKTPSLRRCLCCSSAACCFPHLFTSLKAMLSQMFSPLFPQPCIGLF